MNPTITRGRAPVLMAVTAGLFSTSGLGVKLSTWQPLSILGGRSLLAIGVILLYLDRPRWRWTRIQVIGAVAYLLTQLTFILGIFQIGLSMVLYTLAVPHLRAVETSLILALEPILNPFWVFLVIGEIPGPFALLGGTLVLGAVTARAVVSARGGEADRGLDG